MSATARAVVFAHQAEQPSAPQTSDAQAIALLNAEREVRTLEILAAHTPLSDIALDRINEALQIIGHALKLKRPALGLRPRDPAVTA